MHDGGRQPLIGMAAGAEAEGKLAVTSFNRGGEACHQHHTGVGGGAGVRAPRAGRRGDGSGGRKDTHPPTRSNRCGGGELEGGVCSP